MTIFNPQKLLCDMFNDAIDAAQPKYTLPPFIPNPTNGKLIVIGAGKASAEMARVVEQSYTGQLSGVVVTRYGYSVPCSKISIIEASHPVPDQSSIDAAKQILNTVKDLTEHDTVLCLISGGGSSLLSLPFEGITPAEKQTITKLLLKSGATISEINCVRRHLSAIKGGKLAAACYPARLITLAISDVPGDHINDIASGPTCADQTTCADALSILTRYRIAVPSHITDILCQNLSETIKVEDPRLKNSEYHLIATPLHSLSIAANRAKQAGITPYILGDTIEGESKDVAKTLAGLTYHIKRHNHPFKKPCVLLSGGETTVTIKGNGKGGRNVEFLLALAIALKHVPDIYALAGDTDGVDGMDDIAGAYMTPDTLERAWSQHLNPQQFLDNNDGHHFFELLNQQVITGPTRTNVNDFRAILIV